MKTREQIDLALIDDNPWQPRVAMDPEGVEELADSIAALGLLQAPLARRDTIRDVTNSPSATRGSPHAGCCTSKAAANRTSTWTWPKSAMRRWR